jgi:D-3-phosphoglycerate dehydrogenase
MNEKVVLVTPRSLSKEKSSYLQKLEDAGFTLRIPWPGRQPEEDELITAIAGCSGYVAGVEKITRKVLEAGTDLEIISRNGVGIDNIDMEAAQELHIKVSPTPGANAEGVAELTIGLVLDLLRSITYSHNVVKAGGWERSKGRELKSCTLGLIGCGEIGKRTAKMATALGMSVIGFDVYEQEELKALDGFTYASLDHMYEHADIISLHCPPAGKPLLERTAMKKMKDGVLVINTSRSTLVDEDDMLSALDSKKVAAYAVDAFDKEPPALTPLLLHDRVVLTPHIGGFTQESIGRATEAAIDHIINHFTHRSVNQ